jgi:flagellar hook-associated protein 3 FlgL
MRVTDGMKLISVARTNNASAARVAEATRRASAGARVLAPSDDPVAYASIVRRTATLEGLQGRVKLGRAAADELSLAERALDDASNLVSEAKSLAVQGANETMSPTDRALLADRVRAIRESVIELGNTRGTRGYAFAGTRTDQPPFDLAGAFTGNDAAIRVPISGGVAPRANASGARAFTAAGGRDVLADLEDLAVALDANNVVDIRASIDVIQTGHDQVVAAQVDVGLSMDRFRVVADLNEESGMTIANAIAGDRGSEDIAELITELTAASATYEQSLTVTRRLLALPGLASS